MNSKHYVGSRAKSFTVGAKLQPITGVILNGDGDTLYTAGDDTGYVLEKYIPTATQLMADTILSKLKGFEYQGYTANTAWISPEAELGDGVTIKGIYGLLANREYSFTPKFTENISSPYESEEDHEYSYVGNYMQSLKSTVKLGQLYYGTKITRKSGIEIVKTDGVVEKSRVILNSDKLAFYNDNGAEAFYYDTIAGVFRLSQYSNIEDALDGSAAFSSLEFTSQQLQIQFNDALGSIAELRLTAESLSSTISNVENEVTDLDGKISTTETTLRSEIKQTADSITYTVGSLSMQVDYLGEEIVTTETNLQSRITQTAESITLMVTQSISDSEGRTQEYVASSIEQFADSITLSVTNKGSSSYLTLTGDGFSVSSADIKFTGYVTFSDLSGVGSTQINGANIITGTISADSINLTGAITWNDLDSDVWNWFNEVADAVDTEISRNYEYTDTLVWWLLNGYRIEFEGRDPNTFINGNMIYTPLLVSPEIHTTEFNIWANDLQYGENAHFSLWGQYGSSWYEMLRIEHSASSVSGRTVFWSPAGGSIMFDSPVIFNSWVSGISLSSNSSIESQQRVDVESNNSVKTTEQINYNERNSIQTVNASTKTAVIGGDSFKSDEKIEVAEVSKKVINLVDYGGVLKVELPNTTWYLDDTGWHKEI